MSLLLEALKKAERAKEEAQRRARGETEASELRLEGEDPPATEPAPAADPKPVLTRAELPDIKQPLEILSDDITPPPKAPSRPAASDRPAGAPRPAASPRSQAGPATQPQAQAAERAAARKVFEAKFKEPNPRLPFLITMGFLGVFALGTVAYFWYQLRPPPPLYNANAKPAAGEVLPAAASTRAVAPVPAVASAPAAIPGLPDAPVAQPVPVAAAPSRAVPAPKPAPVPRAAAPAVAPTPVASSAAPASRQSSPTPATRQPPRVHPGVEAGYGAYLAGDLVSARSAYQEALRDDASNRDALLGMAAIETRTGRYEAAEATYLRLLQLDPNDAHAEAGLIALRSARLDPLATENRVKSLLAADPGANVLHFTLGNQLAQQGRWGEAQQEYFKAFAASPDNADFAYNLAVSLDHMRQTRLALDYYRRAIALAEKRAVSFDVVAARARAAQLDR